MKTKDLEQYLEIVSEMIDNEKKKTDKLACGEIQYSNQALKNATNIFSHILFFQAVQNTKIRTEDDVKAFCDDICSLIKKYRDGIETFYTCNN